MMMCHNSKQLATLTFVVGIVLLALSLMSSTTATTTATSATTEAKASPAVPATAATTTTEVASTWPEAKVSRSIQQKVLSKEQGEGAGARVRRSIGRPGTHTHSSHSSHVSRIAY